MPLRSDFEYPQHIPWRGDREDRVGSGPRRELSERSEWKRWDGIASMVGFSDFAQVRSRDNPPGPGSYSAAPEFGPKSASLKKSLLGRRAVSAAHSSFAALGPGSYLLPPETGTGRGTRFGLPQVADAVDDVGRQGAAAGDVVCAAARKPEPEKVRAIPRPIPPQYSMALMPDTPAFSMLGKLHVPESRLRVRVGAAVDGDVEETETGLYISTPGPTSYTLPSMFDQSQHGVPKGKSFAGKLRNPAHVAESDAGRSIEQQAPGPGTYRISRFGDTVPPSQAVTTTRRRRRKQHHSPGPGEYGDPTSIAARLGVLNGHTSVGEEEYSASSVMKAVRMHPTFGGRFPWPPTVQSEWFLDGTSATPGPGSYKIGSDFGRNASRRSHRQRARAGAATQQSGSAESESAADGHLAPRVGAKTRKRRPKGAALLDSSPGPGAYKVPSLFDYDPRKGIIMKGRNTGSAPPGSGANDSSPGNGGLASIGLGPNVGPGSYTIQELESYAFRGRFGPPLRDDDGSKSNSRGGRRRDSGGSQSSGGSSDSSVSPGWRRENRRMGERDGPGSAWGVAGQFHKVSYNLVEPRVRGGLMLLNPRSPSTYASAGSRREGASAKMAPGTASGPGPGSYNIVDHLAVAPSSTARDKVSGAEHHVATFRQAPSRAGTCFYKGHFATSPSSAEPNAAQPGPGDYYNDDTWASKSINGTASSGKGFTFGLRYPARATHDEFSTPAEQLPSPGRSKTG